MDWKKRLEKTFSREFTVVAAVLGALWELDFDPALKAKLMAGLGAVSVLALQAQKAAEAAAKAYAAGKVVADHLNQPEKVKAESVSTLTDTQDKPSTRPNFLGKSVKPDK